MQSQGAVVRKQGGDVSETRCLLTSIVMLEKRKGFGGNWEHWDSWDVSSAGMSAEPECSPMELNDLYFGMEKQDFNVLGRIRSRIDKSRGF